MKTATTQKLLLTLLLPFLLLSCKETSSTAPEEVAGLIWSDEFNGTDWRTNWYPELGDGGWGNNELQNYTANSNNIEVTDSTLKIIARKVDDGQSRGDYTSARLLSKEAFTYGRMEIRAKLPDLKGNGLWPAIWMLGDGIRNGQSWPECGEIDIMEYVSYAPDQFYATVHTGAFNHREGTQKGSGAIRLTNIEEDFNIFGIIWTESYIGFYVENKNNVIFTFAKPQNATNDEWPFDNPHFFLLNMAVGGDWGGAQGLDDNNFPAVFEIDYVRVYELDEE